MKKQKLKKAAKELASVYRISDGSKFRLKDFDPGDTNGMKSKEYAKELLDASTEKLCEYQEKLYAQVRENFRSFLAAREAGRPWFFLFGPTNTHRMWQQGSGKILWNIDPDSLKGAAVDFTHMDLNDNTLEGLRHRELPLFSVQYHPEASPGPHDSHYLFKDFVKMMEEWKG